MTARVAAPAPSAPAKWTLLGALYFSQGLPFGFFTQALPLLLRREGASLGSIGLSTFLALPWALKFLWAPAVDRFWLPRLGRRRSWILPLQLGSVALLTLLALSPRAADGSVSLGLLLGAALVLNLVTATQDVATDGLAVDLLAPGQRGFANGLQVAAYRAGMIAGGGALLILYERQGATASFLAMAALTALASVPVAAAREPSPVPGAAAGAGAAGIGAIARFFRRPGAGRLLAVIVTYKVGDAFATSMLRPFLADSGMGLADVGWLLGTVGFLAGLAGALGGGALVGRLGRRRALLLFGLFQAISVAAYAGLAAGAPPRAAIYVVCAVEHAAGGMATAALFTCMMDWCSREWGATDYTVQASAVVVSTGVASALAGWSAQHLGYFAHFCLAAAVGLGGLLVVRLVFPRSRAAQLRGPEEPSDAIPTEVVP